MRITKRNKQTKQARVTKIVLQKFTNHERTINYLCITSWLQILRLFVAEWVLQHNNLLFP